MGQSDLVDLVGINRDLNSRLSILSHILEVSGNPIAVLENVTNSTGIKVGPGRLWELPKDAKAPTCSTFFRAEAWGCISSTSTSCTGRCTTSPRCRARVRRRRGHGEVGRRAGDGAAADAAKGREEEGYLDGRLRERARMILSLYALHGDEAAGGVASPSGGYTIRVVWPPILPSDRTELVQQETALVAARSTRAAAPWTCWAKATRTLNGRRCLRKRHSKEEQHE